jgi:hypothetical protein
MFKILKSFGEFLMFNNGLSYVKDTGWSRVLIKVNKNK